MPYIGSSPPATALTSSDIADSIITEAKMADDAISLTELKAGTDGEVISWDASGNPVAIGAGTSGHFLKSQGAGSVPVFAEAGGGAWNFIATQTASSSALIAFDTDEITSTYDIYKVFIYGLIPAVDDKELHIQFSKSGSYITSGYRWGAGFAGDNDAGGGAMSATGHNNAGDIQITRNGMGTGTGEHLNLEFVLWNPLNTDQYKIVSWTGPNVEFTPVVHQLLGSGTHKADEAAIDGFKFFCESGNIASGKFSIYGLAKS